MTTNNEKRSNPRNNKDLKLMIILFIMAVIAAGFVRFSVTIAELESAYHSKMWLGISFIAGIAGGIIYRKNLAVSALIVTSGFIIAIVLRIAFDLIFIDPTSHNLFPIELVIWSIMAFIPAIAGSFLGSMVIRLINKSNTEKKVTKSNS